MFIAFHWYPQMVKILITQDQYHLTWYFQDIMVYFRHQFVLTLISAQFQHPELFVPGSDFLEHHRIFQFSILCHRYACN